LFVSIPSADSLGLLIFKACWKTKHLVCPFTKSNPLLLNP
jgi:hypothetical protein